MALQMILFEAILWKSKKLDISIGLSMFLVLGSWRAIGAGDDACGQ